MGREEQAEEREVLDSIFPDEIQDVSASEYRVSIALDVQKPDEDETPGPVILLNIRYPEPTRTKPRAWISRSRPMRRGTITSISRMTRRACWKRWGRR